MVAERRGELAGLSRGRTRLFEVRVQLSCVVTFCANDKSWRAAAMSEQPHSHHRIRLVTSTVVLGLLVLAHTVLICLWGTHALDRHLFSISRVSQATQFISIGAQAIITFLLVLLSYSVQAVAADQIIRQSEFRDGDSALVCKTAKMLLAQGKLSPLYRIIWMHGVVLQRPS